ncbi:MAG: hypothetical protein SWC96_11690 [Thermodesulfobacteriota bacterium]|nr:hypothetical protein [Thermodesulfobacteriota bacterium]
MADSKPDKRMMLKGIDFGLFTFYPLLNMGEKFPPTIRLQENRVSGGGDIGGHGAGADGGQETQPDNGRAVGEAKFHG